MALLPGWMVKFFSMFLLNTSTGTLVWIFGVVSSGFQSRNGLTHSHFQGKCNVHSLRTTSSAKRGQPLDSQYCGAATRFIPCARILLCDTNEEYIFKNPV